MNNNSTASDQNAPAGATGTSGRRSGRLPRTASELPFMALLAFGAFAVAGALRVGRKALL